ncbi:MAG: hypothetical protein HY701_02390, partial [Gemmatimonadetes bacterium]|nr:hypothetical protein [Gemmatimonadota bacterium]
MGRKVGRRGRALALVALLPMGWTCARAPHAPHDASPRRADFRPGVLRVTNELLADRLVSLAKRSPTWRAAMDSLAATGFQVLVMDAGQAPRILPALRDYEPDHVGEVIPLRNPLGAMIGAAVTVDLARLRRLVDTAALPRRVLEMDIDRILIHELYGHVLPLARARRLEGGCPDPAPGEPASSSCAIERENVIRAELGMERR